MVNDHVIYLKCVICLENYSHHFFCALSCGHGVCLDCITLSFTIDLCIVCSETICSISFLGNGCSQIKQMYKHSIKLEGYDMFLQKSTAIVYAVSERDEFERQLFLRDNANYLPLHIEITKIMF